MIAANHADETLLRGRRREPGPLIRTLFGKREAAPEESGDLRLVELFILKRGEAEFRILYRRHAPGMRRVSLRLVGNLGLAADDIVQEAWLRAVRSLARFERRSSFRSWLIGFVVNVAREARKSSGAGPLYLAETPDRPAPSNDPLDALELERAMEKLPAGYRTVLMLHDLGGFTHAEIGDLLGIDEGTSKSQLARARGRLRERLQGGTEARP